MTLSRATSFGEFGQSCARPIISTSWSAGIPMPCLLQVRDQVRRRRPWVGVLDVRQPSRHTINESMPNAHSSRAAFFSCARSSMRISKRRPVALAGKMESWKTWTRPNTVTKRPFSRRVSTGGRRLQTQRLLLELIAKPFPASAANRPVKCAA